MPHSDGILFSPRFRPTLANQLGVSEGFAGKNMVPQLVSTALVLICLSRAGHLAQVYAIKSRVVAANCAVLFRS